MINFLVAFLHIIFVVYVFVKKYKANGAKEGWLNIALIGILFAVGWTLASIIYKTIDENLLHIHTLVYDSVQNNTPLKDWLDNSTIPILMTTTVEAIFYKMYYKDLWQRKAKPAAAEEKKEDKA